MSAFSFLKKKNDALVPPPPLMAPISKLDAKLPPLPPLNALPKLPPVAPVAPAAPLPSPVPAPKPLPPLAPPAVASVKPVMPAPAALPPLFKDDKPRGDLPPISVNPPIGPPTPVAMPAPAPVMPAPAPIPKPAPQPVKHENSKLAKALEELSALDLDIPDVSAPVAPAPKPTRAHAPQAPPPRQPGLHFVPLSHFDEVIMEIHTMHEHLQQLQAKNEKLGMIETHTKQALDSLIQHHEYMQKHLLTVDEKLFKVN